MRVIVVIERRAAGGAVIVYSDEGKSAEVYMSDDYKAAKKTGERLAEVIKAKIIYR